MQWQSYAPLSFVVDRVVQGSALIANVVSHTPFARSEPHRIQLDVDANVYKLEQPIYLLPFTRYSRKQDDSEGPVSHTHSVEVLLTFVNRGRTRFKLYNAQIGINTLLRPRFDEDDGHLHLNRLFTSGNIVPELPEAHQPIEKTSFYSIEPGVEQTIHYLALIPEPQALLQVVANYNFHQQRVSIEEMKRGLYPHSAVRTFQIGTDGLPVRAPTMYLKKEEVFAAT